jgi:hypothetical protein
VQFANETTYKLGEGVGHFLHDVEIEKAKAEEKVKHTVNEVKNVSATEVANEAGKHLGAAGVAVENGVKTGNCMWNDWQNGISEV